MSSMRFHAGAKRRPRCAAAPAATDPAALRKSVVLNGRLTERRILTSPGFDLSHAKSAKQLPIEDKHILWSDAKVPAS